MLQNVPIPKSNSLEKLIPKARRSKAPVLIVEDREENQALIAGICDQLEIPYHIAENGEIGLKKASERSYSVFIVDLMMPVMDGKTFTKLVKEKQTDAVILIQTAIDATSDIIEIMKLGVLDYILKPLNLDLFKATLLRALEYRYLLDVEKSLLTDEAKELRDQLEWLNYKETARKNAGNSVEMTAIYNLKTTLSQGSGFGAMTTLIDTIIMMAKRIDENTVQIDSDLLAILKENNEHTKSMLRGLDKAVGILDDKIVLSAHTSADVLALLALRIKDVEDFAKKKSIQINSPIVKHEYVLNFDKITLSVALQEILLNACKYAPTQSHIDIFVTNIDGYFCLSIKNQVKEDEYGKFADDSEKNLTLPFFRVHPPVEEVHDKEPFSLGLGLTLVEYIANKHHGLFFLRKAKDHTTEITSGCVIAEFFLPLQNHIGENI